MSRLWLLPFAAFLAAPAFAQPVLSDTTEFYVSPFGGFAMSGSRGSAYVLGAEAGRRIGDHADLGVFLAAGDLSMGAAGAFVTLGPTGGLTYDLGGGVQADLRGRATVTFADLGGALESSGFGLRGASTFGQLTFSREIPVVGSFRIAPTVGAYGLACATNGVEFPNDRPCAESGLLAGMDLRFSAFGKDVTIPLVVSIPVAGDASANRIGTFDLGTVPITSGGLRIRF